MILQATHNPLPMSDSPTYNSLEYLPLFFFLALALYHSVLEELIPQFPPISNRFVDVLATLASMIEIPLGFKMCPLI